jgi:hypothetical protein
MTAIKPPVFPAPTATDVASGAVSPSSVQAEKPGESAFSQPLGRAAQAGVEAPQATDAAAGVDALVRDLQAGRVTAEQALDRLVERAAASLDHGLSPEERADLVSVLRAALASDPTLAMLRDSLG